MPLMQTLGVLDSEGNVTDSGRAAFKEDVIDVMSLGPASAKALILGQVNVAEEVGITVGSSLIADGFKTADENGNTEKFDEIIIDGIYAGMLRALDIDVQQGLLTPLGIIDPTIPIARIIEIIRSLNLDLGFEIDLSFDFIIERILELIATITELLLIIPQAIAAGIEAVKDRIIEILNNLFAILGFEIDLSIEFPDFIDEIIQLIIEALTLPSLNIDLPSLFPINFNIPDLSFNFDLNFNGINFPSIIGLFKALVEGIVDFIIGVVESLLDPTKFLELLSNILEFVRFIVEKVKDFFLSIIQGLGTAFAFIASSVVIIKNFSIAMIGMIVALLLGEGEIYKGVVNTLGFST